MQAVRKYVLYAIAAAVVIYSVGLLYHVQEAADLGVHCLFSDKAPSPSVPHLEGPEIRWVDPDIEAVGPMPRLGDRLQSVAGETVPTYLHFKRSVARLAEDDHPPLSAEAAPQIDDPAELARLDRDAGPAVVDLEGDRWARADFVRPTSDGSGVEQLSSWLRLKPVPNQFLVLSLAWFLLAMIVLGIAALVVAGRPRDASALMFYVLSVVYVVTFLGAFHWSDLVGTRLLVYPFVLCTLLVPPTTLHFYLLFPRPFVVLRRWSRTTLAAIYALPVAWIALMFICLVAIAWQHAAGAPPASLATWLHRLILLVYGYIPVGVAMFAVGLGFLIYRFVHSRSRAQRSQLVWVLAAVALASMLSVYLAYTAASDRALFAFGTTTRLMLYLTSVLFMLAYAVSMTRSKLFDVGQVLNRGLVYVAISLAATALFCLLVGVGTTVVGLYAFRLENALAAGMTAMLVVIVLGWLRDRVQRAVDRRFLHERFQLNRAIERLGEAVDRLIEPSQVATQLLDSARDAVGARKGLVYVLDPAEGEFQLTAGSAWPGAPAWLESSDPLLAEVHDGHVVRARSGLAVLPTAGQHQLRDLEGELALGLELDGAVVGVVILGAKDGFGPYTREDANFLVALAKTTSLALRNTQGRQTIEDLRVTLQSQVTKIAEQQQRIRFLQGELLAADSHVGGDLLTAAKETAEARSFEHGIRGSSPALKQMLEQAAKIANSESSVLIRGESGTGKELLARAIHLNSPRADGSFVAVHCAALSPSLLESELFGHVKGAFTGADRDRVGRFEMADGGSLFLDEIGDINLETQTKLLRVLQERSFERVGGVQTINVDVRLIAATHQNLDELIRRGQFRQDLFYRLDVITIWCPALRERRGDVFELALHFLRRFSQQLGKSIVRIDEDALEALAAYNWPGNIRQLENALQRAVVMADGQSITAADLPPEVLSPVPAVRHHRESPRGSAVNSERMGTAGQASSGIRARRAKVATTESSGNGGRARLSADVAELERDRLVEALAQAGGNKSEAARLLGIPRSTLFSKMRRLELD